MAYDVRNINNELTSCDLSFADQCKIIYEGIKRGVKLDGCTGAPDFNFAICCAEHDCYYQGLTDPVISRAEADDRLRKCILKKGIPQKLWFMSYNSNWLLAGFYYSAVRLAGWKFYKGKGKRNDSTVQTSNAPGDVDAP